MSWGIFDIPSQNGRTALVTGASSGIGRETARALAGAGARVILGCRNRDRAERAMAPIRKRHPDAELEFLELDLARLESVRQAAATLRARHDRLDLLINNAGVMWLEESRTVDGLESQFAINHLGHFALTGLLIDRMQHLPGSRVVTVSSLAHRSGRIQFANPNLEGHYGRHLAYAQSKAANLIFSLELQRRLAAAGAHTLSLGAHPGIANTNLVAPGLIRQTPLRVGALVRLVLPFLAQNARSGALPVLYAATGGRVDPGGYYGPAWAGEMMGPPGPARVAGYCRDPEIGRKLWTLSEALTGVEWPLPESDHTVHSNDAQD